MIRERPHILIPQKTLQLSDHCLIRQLSPLQHKINLHVPRHLRLNPHIRNPRIKRPNPILISVIRPRGRPGRRCKINTLRKIFIRFQIRPALCYRQIFHPIYIRNRINQILQLPCSVSIPLHTRLLTGSIHLPKKRPCPYLQNIQRLKIHPIPCRNPRPGRNDNHITALHRQRKTHPCHGAGPLQTLNPLQRPDIFQIIPKTILKQRHLPRPVRILHNLI